MNQTGSDDVSGVSGSGRDAGRWFGVRGFWWFGLGVVLVVAVVRGLVQSPSPPGIPVADFQTRAEEFGEQVLALVDPDVPRRGDDFVRSHVVGADGRIEHGWASWRWRLAVSLEPGESAEGLAEPIITMLLESGWEGRVASAPEEIFIRREFVLDDLGGYWWIIMYTNNAPNVDIIIYSPRF